MKLSDIKVDVNRAEQGDWVSDVPELEGVRLKVRGLSNPDFQRVVDKLTAAVPRHKRVNGRIDPVERDRIGGQALAQTILLDWDGLTQEDGSVLPYSPDLARKLLTEPEFRVFRDGVTWAAQQVADTRAVSTEEDGKNSPTP